MFVAVLAWDLAESPVTFAELRAWVAGTAAAQYAALPGVCIKCWFSNEERRVWGAVYLVESPEAIHPDRLPRLPDGSTGPVGTPPTSVAWFALEACVFGPGDMATLVSAGLAMSAGLRPSKRPTARLRRTAPTRPSDRSVRPSQPPPSGLA